MAPEDCNCNKPAPLGRPQPGGRPQPSLVASQGSPVHGIFHVSKTGVRTKMGDTLAARAAAIRNGGYVDIV